MTFYFCIKKHLNSQIIIIVCVLLFFIESLNGQVTAIGTCDGINAINENTYHILISGLDASTTYDLDLDGDDIADETGVTEVTTFIATNLDYTDGTSFQRIQIDEGQNGVYETEITVHEVLCTDADNDGTLDFDAGCDEDLPKVDNGYIVATVGPYVGKNVYVFVLTNANGNAIAANHSGLFTALPNGNDYHVVALNFLEKTDAITFTNELSFGENGTIINTSTIPLGCAMNCGSMAYDINCRIDDVALTKTINAQVNTNTLGIGDEVIFDITVFNQGTHPIFDVVVNDYIPEGFDFFVANNTTNAFSNITTDLLGGGTITSTLAGPITSQSSQVIQVVLTINAMATNNNLTNIAEISAANQTSGGTTIFDEDNDLGTSSNIENETDNDIDDGMDENPDDQDDFDFATVTLCGGTSLACTGTINVSLDGNCQFVFSTDLFLIGGNNLCYNNFTILISEDNEPINLPTDADGNPIVGIEFIGKTLTVNIIDPVTGNSCWTKVFIEDKFIPEIDCPAEMTIDCLASADTSITGTPTLLNCETSVSMSYQDALIEFEECNNPLAQIERTWTVVDDSGNSSSCVQIISIEKTDFSNIIFPNNLVASKAISCNDLADDTTLIHPDSTGYPTINGIQLISNDFCKTNVIHQDQEVPLCEGSYQIFRTWTVYDWCSPLIEGINPIVFLQKIEVLDNIPPTLECPTDIIVSAASNSCTAALTLPVPNISDGCSATTSFSVASENGVLTHLGGNDYSLSELTVGETYSVVYTAIDACGNDVSCTTKITVVDTAAPLAICQEFTTVTIGSDGSSYVDATVFDKGSYDNCSILKYEVRRSDTICNNTNTEVFGEYVTFCCSDIGTEVMVEFQITDASGNTNSCMTQVEVQDKIAPTLSCPSGITIECDQDLTNLQLTKEPIAFDNCAIESVDFQDFINIDPICKTGTVTRTWTAIDVNNNKTSCVQNITIINSDLLEEEDIIFPEDLTTNDCNSELFPSDLPAEFAEPLIENTSCGSIDITYNDLELETELPSCLKILRTWIVIDQCQYESNNNSTSGYFQHVQVIKVMNTTPPIVTSLCEDLSFCSYDDDCGGAFVDLLISANDDCKPTNQLSFSYEIDFDNDGFFDVTGSGNDASNNYPMGTHRMVWQVADGYGNSTTCTQLFTISDCKKPTPVCIAGLATPVMPTSGTIELKATFFDVASSFDNCTNSENLRFSFSTNTNDTLQLFTCNDVVGNSITVDIWVTDETGNQNYCTTSLSLQDPDNVCSNFQTVSVLGNILTEDGEEVENVRVHLSDNNNITSTLITNINGTFTFPNIPMNNPFTMITPEKDTFPINGVTTFDLVLISKHILGLQFLDSPYKMIAADANRSNSVTTFDIVLIRRLILQMDEEYAFNTSWRFVPTSFIFPDPSDPFVSEFPEMVNFDGINNNASANFVGVKIGDVNDSAQPNSLVGAETRTTNGKLIFNLEDKEMKAGSEVKVEFKAEDFETNGYQFTLEFNPNYLEFIKLQTQLEGLHKDNFGLTKIEEGIITTSWNKESVIEVEKGKPIFSLQFHVLKDAQLSNLLSINSKNTKAEAYRENDQLDIVLNFSGKNISAHQFELYQNRPNPFKDLTTIGFNLPKASSATLRIFDASGKIHREITKNFEKGYNEITISKAELVSNGLLIYELETPEHLATKKMLIID